MPTLKNLAPWSTASMMGSDLTVASGAEVIAGTENAKAVTPLSLTNAGLTFQSNGDGILVPKDGSIARVDANDKTWVETQNTDGTVTRT